MLPFAPVLAFFDTTLGKYLLMALVAIATAVAFGAWQRSIGYREAMDQVNAQREEESRAWLAVMARRGVAFQALQEKHVALTAQHEQELRAAEERRRNDINALKNRIPTYVPIEVLRDFPGLPGGYLMLRADAAALANGSPVATTPAPSADAARAPSGVSLADLAVLDADQAAAFATCRARVDGWLKYHADVEAWAAEVSRALQDVP